MPPASQLGKLQLLYRFRDRLPNCLIMEDPGRLLCRPLSGTTQEQLTWTGEGNVMKFHEGFKTNVILHFSQNNITVLEQSVCPNSGKRLSHQKLNPSTRNKRHFTLALLDVSCIAKDLAAYNHQSRRSLPAKSSLQPPEPQPWKKKRPCLSCSGFCKTSYPQALKWPRKESNTR